MEPLPSGINIITKQVVDASFHVHKTLGPGLLESVYEVCLAYELSQRNLKFKTQVAVPVTYNDVQLDVGFRLDMLVEDRVILELKAVEHILPLHEAQLLTYLKLTNLRLGLLINFNVPLIKDGIKRIIR